MTNLDSLEVQGFENKIRNSIYNKHIDVINTILKNTLQGKEDNFSVPVIQSVLNESNMLQIDLLNVYNSKFPCDTSDIDYEIKLLQASLLDGLVVGFNVNKGGEFKIYTANVGAIFGVDYESKFNIEKTLGLNREGVLHAVRVDVDYTSEAGFKYKVVSLNKNTNIKPITSNNPDGSFYLVPYSVVSHFMSFFKNVLDSNNTLLIKQDKGELIKERYITKNIDILSQYCDNSSFAKSLKTSYFPLKGFFYAPVVGASSLTSGVTRVDLIDVCSVNKVNEIVGVSKAKDGFNEMIKESCIMATLQRMYSSDLGAYSNLINNLPNKDILTGEVADIDKGLPNPKTIIKYMHSLNDTDKEDFYSLFTDLDGDVFKKRKILYSYEEMNINDFSVEELRELLNNGVYKFQLRKKDCINSTIMVTNSVSILKEMYGDDYYAKYESFGVRLRGLQKFLEHKSYTGSSGDVIQWLRYCGMEVSTPIVTKIMGVWQSGVKGRELYETLSELLNPKTSKTKKVTRKSASNDNLILARVCLPSITSSGDMDFYRYLDIDNVVGMYRIG